MTDNTNKHFYRSVKIQMTPEQMASYTPYHRGLDFNFYNPVFEDTRLLNLQQARKMITTYDLTITACSINPDPLCGRDMRDIDEELAMMDSKYKIIKDHLTPNDRNDLIHIKQPKESLTKHATITTHPYLEGENDYLKSKMKDVHDIEIPLQDIKNFEKHVEKKKAFYNKIKLDYVEKLDEQTGRKVAKTQFGYIT
jgi:hypothetical protein